MTGLIWERNDVLNRWYGREPYTADGRSDVLAIVQRDGEVYRLFSIPGDLEHYTVHYSLESAQYAAAPGRVPYPYDPAIRALNAAISALQLARNNASADLAIEQLDQALQHVRQAVACTNTAIGAEDDAPASTGDDETD